MLIGCSSDTGPRLGSAPDGQGSTSTSTASGGTDSGQTDSERGDSNPPTDEPVSTPADGVSWTTCSRTDVDSSAAVTNDALVETSGLVASTQHDGVLWAHNDSGSEAGVFAVGVDGGDQGFFSLDGIEGRDIEDMALANGRIHLGDIGDNNRRRESIAIYVFDEPTPGQPGGTVSGAATITASYPDGPTDAEALLVDPLSDEILILSKDLDDGEALTRIYEVPRETGTAEPVTMTLVASIDVFAFTGRSTEFSITSVLFPGQVTAADISSDGAVIALRTYGSVWLFPRTSGQTMAEALAGEPCEAGTASERQGEAVAFIGEVPGSDGPGTLNFVTIGEGSRRPINLVTVELN